MIEELLLNCAIVALCVWAVLRVPEKILDIMNKYKKYKEEGKKNDTLAIVQTLE